MEIIARIAFTTDPFATVPTWVDVSIDLMSFSLKRGRQHELNRMEAGTADLRLLNLSGNYWPNNSGGPYYGYIIPMRRVNIRAVYGANTYDIYTGFVESWKPGFLMKPIKGAIMDISSVDLIGALSQLELNNAGYPQELSGTRVGKVLDDLNWPAGDRNLDAGQSEVQATGALSAANAQSHLFSVQVAESGIIFIMPDGKVEFQDRHARLKSPYTVSQGIFGDGAGELGYHAVELAYDDTHIYNDVRLTREGGAEQVAEDATSQARYGKRTFSRSGLLSTSDLETLNLAQYLLSKYKEPFLRAKSLVIRPGADEANLLPKVLSFDISTRITVRLSEADIDEDYYIEGIEHSWDAATKIWETKWQLSPAVTDAYWALGVAGYSELGVTTKLAF